MKSFSGVLTTFALQLLGLTGDGEFVQSHLWEADLHLPQLEAFLREASNETQQVKVRCLNSGNHTLTLYLLMKSQ